MSETIFYIQGWRYAYDAALQPTSAPEPVLLQVSAPRDAAFSATFTAFMAPFAGPFGTYEFDLGGAEWLLDGELITETHLARTLADDGYAFNSAEQVSQGQIGFWVRPRDSREWFDGAPPAEDNRFFVADSQGPQWAYQGSLLKIHQEGTVSSFWIDGSAPGAGESAALAGDLVYDDFLAAWWSHIPEGSTSNNAGSSTELFHFPGADNRDGYFDIPSDPIPYDSFKGLILISEDAGAGVEIGPEGMDLQGGEDFDIFISGEGDDRFDGGPGSGAVVYTGNAADYTVTTDPDTGITTVTDNRTQPAAVTNGQDTLSNIERLIFAGEIVVLGEGDGGGNGAAPGPGSVIPGGPWPDDDTVMLTVSLRSLAGDPLPGATVGFYAPNGAEPLAEVAPNAEGRLAFAVAPGTAARIEAGLAHEGSPAVETRDALEILRLSVGLDPSWGPATPLHFIAADVDRSGEVNATDALAVLRHAVGLGGGYTPEWVFVDSHADYSTLSAGDVSYATGLDIAAMSGDADHALTGILLGSMVEAG